MKVVYPLLAVVALVALGLAGGAVSGLRGVFAVAIPYLAFAVFIVGVTYRVIRWARSPVPFRIPTTSGQQKSLAFIKADNLESPYNTWGVLGRMGLEVLVFRSLFRNTSVQIKGNRLVYGEAKLLWLFGLVFHWSLLVVVVRHSRFFLEPVPFAVTALQNLDGLFQIGVPVFYITSLTLLAGLLYLFGRRLWVARVRYISLPSDYFALFLILGIGLSGGLMRHLFRTDVAAVKELAMGLVALRPAIPDGVSPLFFAHLLLVSTLLAYFPLSKLMHAGGIFLSPTRNLANDNRMRRHRNPWNYPVDVHPYREWQEEFRDKMVAADMPLDEDLEPEPHAEPAVGQGEGGAQPRLAV